MYFESNKKVNISVLTCVIFAKPCPTTVKSSTSHGFVDWANNEYTQWPESDMKQMHQGMLSVTWADFWIVTFETINNLHSFFMSCKIKIKIILTVREYELNWGMGAIIQLNTVETWKQPRMLAFSYRVTLLNTPAMFSTAVTTVFTPSKIIA